MKDKKKKVNINVNRKPDSTRFSNAAFIGHSEHDFKLIFMNELRSEQTPDGGVTVQSEVIAEIVLTPAHMRALIAEMQDNFKRYEDQFGRVAKSKRYPVPGDKEYHRPKTGSGTAPPSTAPDIDYA